MRLRRTRLKRRRQPRRRWPSRSPRRSAAPAWRAPSASSPASRPRTMTPCSVAVQFFVDGQLVGEDKTAPYAIEWTDENPFEVAEISVQVQDGHGNIARDKILLKPIDVSQSTSVQSVLLEPQVLDAKGRPVNGLKPENFRVLEDGVPQKLDVAKPDAMPATYTLLIDTSDSMSRRIDFVREAAGKLPALLRPIDTVVVAPFSKTLGAITGPTRDAATIAGAIDEIKPTGGTAILDNLSGVVEQLDTSEGRHAIVVITDGYDEHSAMKFERALSSVKAAGITRLRDWRRRRRRHLARRRRSAAPHRGRDRRTRVLSVPRVTAAGRPRADRRRRADALRPDLHAEEPEARRQVAGDHGRDERPDARDQGAEGLHGAAAAADQAVDRAHDPRQQPAAGGRRRRRPRRPRGRRRAEGRGVPGGGRAGVDHPGARRERQHEARGADGHGIGAEVRGVAAREGQAGGHDVLGQDGHDPRPDDDPRLGDGRHQTVFRQRRHGAVRRGRRERCSG